MNNETSVNEMQLMWQSLQREHSIMSLEEVRVRARDAYSILRRNLVISFVLGAVVIVLSTIAVITIPYLAARIVSAGLIVLTGVGTITAYRRMWLRPTPADFAATGCVDFYRTELETQHRSLQMTWRFLAAIAVLSFLTAGAWLQIIRLNARIALPVVLLIVMIERRHQAVRIKRKLNALDTFEKDNV